MKFIKSNPSKSSGWKILEENYNGEIIYNVNYKVGRWGSEFRKRDSEGRWFKPKKYLDTVDVYVDAQEIDNFVFEASFQLLETSKGRSAVVFHFKDTATNFEWTTGTSGLNAILEGVRDNTIKVDAKNTYTGMWTFRRQGSETYFYPYKET